MGNWGEITPNKWGYGPLLIIVGAHFVGSIGMDYIDLPTLTLQW